MKKIEIANLIKNSFGALISIESLDIVQNPRTKEMDIKLNIRDIQTNETDSVTLEGTSDNSLLKIDETARQYKPLPYIDEN